MTPYKNEILNIFHNIIYKRIYFIILFSFLYEINCFIKIPIKYYPDKIRNNSNVKDVILNILDLSIYGLLEMGTPKQIINIPIRFLSNTFFLPQKSSYYYSINPSLNLYEDNNSTTFSIVNDVEFYEGENFQEALYVKDVFYFGNEKAYLDFYLSTSYFFPQMGGLGLQLYPSNKINTATPSIDKTFLRKLKIKGLINNYIWTLFYNRNKNEDSDGFILIGDYPHLTNDFLIDKKYNYSLNSIEAKIYDKIVGTSFDIDNVYVYIGDNIINDINFGNDIINIRLDYNFGGIFAPEQLRLYLEEKIFNNNNFCHKETVNRISKNIIYYCENNENEINKIKKNFPTIKFESKILNTSFIINIDDLLYVKDNYIYILLVFEENSISEWILGVPFLKKYQFSINVDSKRIAFYKKFENTDNNNEKQNYLYIIIIIVLFLILLIIGVVIGIVVINKNKRKKRKNELDDNYDYIINNDKIGNNDVVNDKDKKILDE